MLKRFFLAAATLSGLFLLFLVTVVANSRFTMPHPRDPNVKMLLTDHGAVQLREEEESAAGKATGIPKVEVLEPVFHFGTMPADTHGQHAFEVRNAGTAPLTLNVAGTSCKCTVGGVSANEIAPGDKALVTLEWHAKFKDQDYSQSAEVRTNDPVTPTFVLRIAGKVRRLVGTEGEELVVPNLLPGQSGTAEILIYSDSWDELEIIGMKTSLPRIVTEFLPVESPELKRLGAKSARRLRVTVPGNLPSGEFRDDLRIEVAPTGKREDMLKLELPLRGKVLPRFTILGPVNERDGLLLGQVPQGSGKSLRALIKLRDEDLLLPVRGIEVQPTFLKVTLTPHQEADLATPGLFDLTVEVPAEAPLCQYLGNPQGSLRITTGHPRVPEIRLKVMLAVVP